MALGPALWKLDPLASPGGLGSERLQGSGFGKARGFGRPASACIWDARGLGLGRDWRLGFEEAVGGTLIRGFLGPAGGGEETANNIQKALCDLPSGPKWD